MLCKLYYHTGVSGKSLEASSQLVSGYARFALIDGSISETYTLLQGTRQGGVLSPWLFLVFIDDFIHELSTSKLGIAINSLHYGSPMFADDLTMLSRLKSGLGRMLQNWHGIIRGCGGLILTWVNL